VPVLLTRIGHCRSPTGNHPLSGYQRDSE